MCRTGLSGWPGFVLNFSLNHYVDKIYNDSNRSGILHFRQSGAVSWRQLQPDIARQNNKPNDDLISDCAYGATMNDTAFLYERRRMPVKCRACRMRGRPLCLRTGPYDASHCRVRTRTANPQECSANRHTGSCFASSDAYPADRPRCLRWRRLSRARIKVAGSTSRDLAAT
jgi:hypothetical protein